MPADIIDTTVEVPRKQRVYSSVTSQLAPDPPAPLARIYSLEDFEPHAGRQRRRRIFGFVEGGMETNAARNANRAAFAACSFRPRVRPVPAEGHRGRA